MIIRKRPEASVQTTGLAADKPSETPAIRMWEQVNKFGRTFYVPLDRDFHPIGDLALEELEEAESDALAHSLQIVPHFEAPASWDPKIESLVEQCIRRLLSDGDATTYEIYESLVGRFQASDLLDSGSSVDLLRILRQNFNCYEFENERGVLLRKWTLDEERAAAHPRPPTTLTKAWGVFIKRSAN